MTENDLKDMDIDCTPGQYTSALVSSACFLGVILIVVGALIFGERPTTAKPLPTPIAVATTR